MRIHDRLYIVKEITFYGKVSIVEKDLPFMMDFILLNKDLPYRKRGVQGQKIISFFSQFLHLRKNHFSMDEDIFYTL